LYDLKTDSKFPYHYFISVGIKTMMSDSPGKMFIKHGPLKFTNDDVKRMQDASLMTKDKLFRTTNKEAMAMYGVEEITHAVWSMCIAAAANQCTVHHFSSDFQIEDDYWKEFVERANHNEFEREKLNNAIINKARGFI